MSVDNEMDKLESIAGQYRDKFLSGWEGLYKEKRKRMIGCYAPFIKGGVALEMGVADGASSVHIAPHFEELTLLDGSATHLEETTLMLEALHAARIVSVHSLFEDFQPEKKYDAIFMNHVLEHLDDPVEMLRRVSGWLGETGRLFCAVPNSESINRYVGWKMGMIEHPSAFNEQDIVLGHKRVYNPDQFTRHVTLAGFDVVHFGGLMVKPLTNRQLTNYPKELVEAFFAISPYFPEICSEIYIVAEKSNS